METTQKKSSLKRMSIMIAVVALIVLILSFWLGRQAEQLETAQLLRVCGWITLGMAAAAFVIDQRNQIYGFSQTRQAKYGANAVILSLSVIGVVILANYLAHRHDVEFDLTENKSFSLSDQTVQILQDLKEDVKVTAFYRQTNAQRQELLNRLESYRKKSNGKLSFEIVDPDAQPLITMQYGIRSPGTVVVEQGEARKDIMSHDEEQITSALISITRSEKPKIYFLSGHNELDPEQFDQRYGLSNMKTRLEKENYEVAKLLFPQSNYKVPEDAEALVIAGPESPLNSAERQAIREYVEKRQGNLMLMTQTRFDTGLEAWLNTLGVRVGSDLLIDRGQNIQGDVTIPAFTNFAFHPITKDLGRSIVFTPLTRTVTLDEELPENVQGTELLSSTPNSWAETNLTENSLIQQDPGDRPGPLSAAVAVTLKADEKKPANTEEEQSDEAKKEEPAESRILVVGTHLFATNFYTAAPTGNSDFFLNAMAWLAEEESLISIRSKPTENRSLQLTNGQQNMAFMLSVVVFPVLFLVLGAGVWFVRR